ncbi:EAL domain-containing protein [Jannaschia sp. R86511]|uniref:sensor domain-containing phosphodiesterase n=1 Tax=Jannaschia sp. R86511 TaxID=3093853 RepID=UPI0036D3EFD8
MTGGGTATPVQLPDVLLVAEELASGRRDDLEDCLHVILAGLRDRLGFDVTFVGEISDGTRRVRAVEAPPGSDVLPVGLCEPSEDTYCARVADGRLPALVPDARTAPEVADLPVTTELPVGTHLSVPIRFSDGTVFGTLCGFTHVPAPGIRDRDVGVMRLLARLLGRYLEQDRQPSSVQDPARQQVQALLAAGGPRLVFQPVRNLETLHVLGYEALSRFDDGSAETWFARAAVVGLGVQLEVSAVRRAVAHLDRLPTDVYLAVNVSAAALCSEELADALAGVDLSRLVLELTEQTGVPDYDLLRARVAVLRERGGRLAVDDAGAGYAGLQRIVEIAPDVIKLDRAMVSDVAVDHARQAMVQALTWFARRTGATLVAEGVEDRAQVLVLRRLGVPVGQGYHLGRPEQLAPTG